MITETRNGAHPHITAVPPQENVGPNIMITNIEDMKAGQEGPPRVTTTILHQRVLCLHPTMITTTAAQAVAATHGPRGQAAPEGQPGRRSEILGIVAVGMSLPGIPGITDINSIC